MPRGSRLPDVVPARPRHRGEVGAESRIRSQAMLAAAPIGIGTMKQASNPIRCATESTFG